MDSGVIQITTLDGFEAAMTLKMSLTRALRNLDMIPRDQLIQRRYEKFRRMGQFEEAAIA